MTSRDIGDFAGWIVVLGACAVAVEHVARVLSPITSAASIGIAAIVTALIYLPVAPGLTVIMAYGALRELRSPRAHSVAVGTALVAQFVLFIHRM